MRPALALLFVLVVACDRSGQDLPTTTGPTEADLDAEAARMLLMPLGRSVAPFDAETTLFDGKPVATLLELLRTSDEDGRRYAAENLWCVHHGCTRETAHSLSSYPRPEIRRHVLRVVESGRVSDRARVVVPALVGALKDPSAEVRRAVARSLTFIGPEALAACTALHECLDDTDGEVRVSAAGALWSIRLETEAPMRTFVAVLRHDSKANARLMAACNLGRMGKAAHEALGDLEQASRDPDADVRRQVEQAIKDIRR